VDLISKISDPELRRGFRWQLLREVVRMLIVCYEAQVKKLGGVVEGVTLSRLGLVEKRNRNQGNLSLIPWTIICIVVARGDICDKSQ